MGGFQLNLQLFMLIAIARLRFPQSRHLLLSWVAQQKQVIGIPFKITQKDALAKIESTVGFFDYKIKQEEVRTNKFSNDTLRGQFIPFYGGKAREVYSEYAGQYGISTTQKYISIERNSSGKYVPVTKTRTRTDWYPAHGILSKINYSYLDPSDTNLQLYGGYTYPRKIMETALAHDATKLIVLSKDDLVFEGKEKQVVWHEMKEKLAKERLWSRIEAYQFSRAEADIRKKNPIGDSARVNKLNLRLDKTAISVDRFHYPAYVCKYSNQPPLYRIVNGNTGRLEGNFMLSSVKIGVVVSAVCSIVALLASLHPPQILLVGGLGLLAGMTYGGIHNSIVKREVSSMELEKNEDSSIEPTGQTAQKVTQIEENRQTTEKHKVDERNQPIKTQKSIEVQPAKHTIPDTQPNKSQDKPSVEPGIRSTAIDDANDPANIILEDEYCKLLNLRMGKKYTLREFNEANDRALKKWSPPQYTGNAALGASMIKQLNSIYEYTLKRSNRRK